MKTKFIAASAWLACTFSGFGINSAWALLPIQHWQQPSGAQVWLVESPSIPMVDIQVDFDAGSRRDPAGKAGLAAAVSLMAAKGIRADGKQPALDENALGEAWADLGAGLEASVGPDSFSYTLRSLTVPDLLQRAVDLASRQIAQPSWPAEVWQRERARWSASIAESNTRPGTVARRAYAQAVYSGHPYGQRVTEQTLQHLQIRDMQAFHAQTLQACRAKVSVVGAVDKAQADALVTRLLARLPKDDGHGCQPLPAVAEVPALQQAQDIRIPFQSAQAQVLIGQPGIKRNDPDFLALLVGDHILGGGGLVSRLMEEVREKRGLTYGVSSSFAPGLHAGAFTVGLQTRPDQAEQARQVAQATLAQFVAEGPTEQELRDAKDNLIGSFALRIDSNRKLLANVANIAWNGLPLDYLDHWTAKIEALTTDDVRRAMQRVLQPERMVTVVLGEKK
ncbi:pitrilysin family protein [Comamonas aquatica]|uniref:M16 family metallopeptidase n=1 Tax=Comamonas aquatica TaxID=225991 RepID=UPI0028D1387F|nr:pitrilysin family protein [Comamonas aquatica]